MITYADLTQCRQAGACASVRWRSLHNLHLPFYIEGPCLRLFNALELSAQVRGIFIHARLRIDGLNRRLFPGILGLLNHVNFFP